MERIWDVTKTFKSLLLRSDSNRAPKPIKEALDTSKRNGIGYGATRLRQRVPAVD